MEKDLKMISPCGINCGECPAYKVSISGNMKDKKRLAKEWSTPNCKFNAKEIYCTGCLETEWKMTSDCKIRKCCKARKLTNCACCKFYPCEKCNKNDMLDVIRNSTSERNDLED
ncbi:DUF3795 domain-containing protein [Clostridium neuense]|uniref:DUF3795 domain-containing protein n=1 Tax=Clostridium neuense TaxID=1728934 RepID=A0ABW8TK37_9CLOT